MTANQVAYWNYQETARSNAAKERETNRSNLVKEAETERANIAKEKETNRANLAKEAETYRANTRQEQIAESEQRKKYGEEWTPEFLRKSLETTGKFAKDVTSAGKNVSDMFKPLRGTDISLLKIG